MSEREVAERLRKRRQVQLVQTEEGSLYVRGLSGTERKEYLERFREKLNGTDVLIADQHLVALALCDQNGAPLYGNFDETLAAVCDWAIPTAQMAAKTVLELSGLAKDSLEGAEKNS